LGESPVWSLIFLKQKPGFSSEYIAKLRVNEGNTNDARASAKEETNVNDGIHENTNIHDDENTNIHNDENTNIHDDENTNIHDDENTNINNDEKDELEVPTNGKISHKMRQNRKQKVKKQKEMPLIECPHCGIGIQVLALNCRVFRCGVYKNSGKNSSKFFQKQIKPHLKKVECDRLVEQGLIYGCGKPFKIIRTEDNQFKPISCGYI